MSEGSRSERLSCSEGDRKDSIMGKETWNKVRQWSKRKVGVKLLCTVRLREDISFCLCFFRKMIFLDMEPHRTVSEHCLSCVWTSIQESPSGAGRLQGKGGAVTAPCPGQESSKAPAEGCHVPPGAPLLELLADLILN